MANWSLEKISDQIDNSVSGVYELAPETLCLILGALSTMECRHQWRGASGRLTDEEYDTVEEWVSRAYKDVLTPMVAQYDQFYYEEDQGTAGGSISSGENTVPWTAWESGNAGNVELDTNVFTVQPGRYLIEAFVTVMTVTSYEVYVHVVSPEKDLPSLNLRSDAYARVGVVSQIVNVTAEQQFEIRVWASTSGSYGVAQNRTGRDERYAQVNWVKLS